MSRATLVGTHLSSDRIVQVGDGFCLVETDSAQRIEFYLRQAASWETLSAVVLIALEKAGVPLTPAMTAIKAALALTKASGPVMLVLNRHGRVTELWRGEKASWRQIRSALTAVKAGAR